MYVQAIHVIYLLHLHRYFHEYAYFTITFDLPFHFVFYSAEYVELVIGVWVFITV